MSLEYQINVCELVIIQNVTAQASLLRQTYKRGTMKCREQYRGLYLYTYCNTKSAFRFPKLLFYNQQ